jgi:hypothetical protein
VSKFVFDLLHLLLDSADLISKELNLHVLEVVHVLFQGILDLHVLQESFLRLYFSLVLFHLNFLLLNCLLELIDIFVKKSQEAELGKDIPEGDEDLEFVRCECLIVDMQQLVHV